ncbi:MAG TPA: uracil-DNA glycosylase [Roseococcus sp.]|jgi:DNA polymerase|nr:uracil-DNA glycosylase [Roseococcus sp.]
MEMDAALLAALQWQIAMGADEAIEPQPIARAPAPAAVAAPPPAPRRATSAATLVPGQASEAETLAAGADSLEALLEAMRRFSGSPLRDTATNLVFADGLPGAPVMIVGEAPGADEDRLGKPFVGVSGQLMDRMMASIGLTRARDLYVTNILPYRPPGNRTPSDGEVSQFLPFVRRHIALAQPRILVLCGGVSAKGLLQTREGITRLRGKWQKVQISASEVIPGLPTLHPAYLLRNPVAKREAWADLLLLRQHLHDGEIVAAPP